MPYADDAFAWRRYPSRWKSSPVEIFIALSVGAVTLSLAVIIAVSAVLLLGDR